MKHIIIPAICSIPLIAALIIILATSGKTNDEYARDWWMYSESEQQEILDGMDFDRRLRLILSEKQVEKGRWY